MIKPTSGDQQESGNDLSSNVIRGSKNEIVGSLIEGNSSEIGNTMRVSAGRSGSNWMNPFDMKNSKPASNVGADRNSDFYQRRKNESWKDKMGSSSKKDKLQDLTDQMNNTSNVKSSVPDRYTRSNSVNKKIISNDVSQYNQTVKVNPITRSKTQSYS